MKKAYESIRDGDAEIVCLLLPSRTGTAWHHDYALPHAEITHIRGRSKFGDSTNSAPFDSLIAVYGLSERETPSLLACPLTRTTAISATNAEGSHQ